MFFYCQAQFQLASYKGERIFEYIQIFEYFSPNIRYSNTNIVIFGNEYIRLFVILVTNIRIFEYLNIRYQNNEYCQSQLGY